jgi:excinuclease ABC subunit C
MPDDPIRQKVEHLPTSPGVYQFFDEDHNALYVGKAKRLRNRVQSYFREAAKHDRRIQLMVSRVSDFEVIVTDSEAEALILENTLIKEKKPRYNIMYRDDKSYPYICVTSEHRPRVYPTRTIIRDGSRYFGPYDHVGHMRRMLETIRKTFGFCTCAVTPRMVDKMRGAPKWGSCFDDYLENCSNELEAGQYRVKIEHVERMLNGKTSELIRQLKQEMDIAAKALSFEQAARLRDAIESVERFNKKMKVVAGEEVNRDLFSVARDNDINEACGVLFKIREGKLVGKFHRYLKNIDSRTDGELLQSFVEDYYTGQFAGAIPDEVYVSHELPEADPLLEYLWQQRGRKVPLHEPKIGEKKQFIRMAISNARLMLGERKLEKEKAERERIPKSVKDLKQYLKLKQLPRRIECFDNSNTQGSDPVASMVTFVDATPRKSLYKRFHIKSVTGADDVASMREIVGRRYRAVKDRDEQPPDLIVVDGGRAQLNAAVEALAEIDYLDHVDVIGLAKRLEEVYLTGQADSVMLPKTSPALKLLQKARDEAHRFAVSFHQKKRSKRTLKTELTEIKGVGEKRANELLKTFGSVKRIRELSLEELQEAAGAKTGKAIFEHFHSRRVQPD